MADALLQSHDASTGMDGILIGDASEGSAGSSMRPHRLCSSLVQARTTLHSQGRAACSAVHTKDAAAEPASVLQQQQQRPLQQW